MMPGQPSEGWPIPQGFPNSTMMVGQPNVYWVLLRLAATALFWL